MHPRRGASRLPGRRLRRAVAAGCLLSLGALGCAADEPDEGGGDPAETADVDTPSGDTEQDAPDGEQPAEPGEDADVEDGDERAGDEPAGDDEAIIAEAVVDEVSAYAAPGDDEPIHEFQHPREVGAPLTFLVDDRDGDWLQVLLPVRPNGSTGWIHADDVTLAATSYRVEVELSEHRLTVHRGDQTQLTAEIGVGGDGTPTPPGRYYVTELLRPPDPDGLYGPYAFGLSGFSEVHLDFAGGEGVIGIHGTNDPSSIGRDVSNGCIRVDNEVITEMASFLPLGTPVEIHA